MWLFSQRNEHAQLQSSYQVRRSWWLSFSVKRYIRINPTGQTQALKPKPEAMSCFQCPGCKDDLPKGSGKWTSVSYVVIPSASLQLSDFNWRLIQEFLLNCLRVLETKDPLFPNYKEIMAVRELTGTRCSCANRNCKRSGAIAVKFWVLWILILIIFLWALVVGERLPVYLKFMTEERLPSYPLPLLVGALGCKKE